MPTDTDLVNQGLTIVGQTRIASLDDPVQSATIQTAKFFLPRIKAAMLRAHDWNCVRRRAQLATATNESLGEYSAAYRLPTDNLCVRNFVSDCTEIRYARFSVEIDSESKPILYTNDGNNKIVYTGNIADVNRWDTLLFDSCATRLAVEFASVFPRDVEFMEKMLKLYSFKMEEAVGVNEQEGGLARHYSDSIAGVR